MTVISTGGIAEKRSPLSFTFARTEDSIFIRVSWVPESIYMDFIIFI